MQIAPFTFSHISRVERRINYLNLLNGPNQKAIQILVMDKIGK